uniref:Uncharacterized protein n=1 Tax=Oryza meridionalis TaxID=40149 RepID=A0A0E0E104_9ORYZ
MGNEECIPAPGRRPTRRRATAARSKESSSEFPNPSHRRRRPLPATAFIPDSTAGTPSTHIPRSSPRSSSENGGFPPAGEGRAGGSGDRRPANPPERGERGGGDYGSGGGRKAEYLSRSC